MKTVIIGLGNPILTDDSVGIKVSCAVRDLLRDTDNSCSDTIEVKEIYAGGIRLMDAMTGYDRACIVDAMVTGRFRPGEVREFSLDQLCSTRNIICTHDTNLSTALELGKMLEMHLPAEIKIWGIEACDVTSFGEQLTDEVAGAVPVVVNAILNELRDTENEDIPVNSQQSPLHGFPLVPYPLRGEGACGGVRQWRLHPPLNPLPSREGNTEGILVNSKSLNIDAQKETS